MSRKRSQLEAQIAELFQRTGKLEARVEELETENAGLRAQVRRLQRDNKKLKRTNRKLADENRLLRREVRRLGGDPAAVVAGAEAPPAEEQDDDDDEDPGGDQAERGRRGRRSRGGQPCHEGKTRLLFPPDKVDHVVTLKPEACEGCGGLLSGEDASPSRHQVVEIPEPKIEVTEFQQHTIRCSCGARTTAPLPAGVPRGQVGFGCRLQAYVGYLAGGCRLSKRKIQGLFQDTFGLKVSLGAISNCERIVSEALVEPVAEAHAFAQTQTAAYVDETGWIEGRTKVYLWGMVTSLVTIFLIRPARCRETARELLGGFRGALITDRLKTYYYWPIRRHQFCWAHLKRRFEEFLLAGPESQAVGAGLLQQTRKLFSLWYRARDGDIARSTLRSSMSPVRREVRALLVRGEACTDPETAGTCRELLAKFEALWTFVRVEGVEPTNNAAERSLRHGVLWRRASFGTDSARGSRFVERVLTAVASLSQQDRNVLQFLTDACRAKQQGGKPPSLLPQGQVSSALAKSA